MTPSEVKAYVAKIRQATGDPEAAHGMEDSLYRDLLHAIADGTCQQPQACAYEAIKAWDLDFPRWYA